MVKKMYSSLKKYFVGHNMNGEQDVFEKVKIDLLFNLFVIFTVTYLLGFIKITLEGQWYLFLLRLAGIILIISFFYALKKTKHYEVPAMIWGGTIVVFGIQGLLLNNGNLTFANLGFALLNVSVAVLLLNRTIKLIFYFYYVVFLTYGLLVTYGFLDPVNIQDVSSNNQKFYQSNIIFTLVPFFLLIYVMFIFVTHEYKVSKELGKQINFVSQQEKEINVANQSMHKSIQLASRIQRAFLPKLDGYKSFFEGHFLLLKPKHELSGDFYWAAAYEDNLYFAIIDSAENNVTGAIVSSVYYDALDSAIKEKQLTSTSDIIQFLGEYISAKTDIKDLKEGIHISLLRIDRKSKLIYFSGEKNSLYIAKKGKKVIDEYKAHQISDKFNEIKYKEVAVGYDSGDTLYMTSDGFSAQFKGFSNSKFKESVLKTYIASIKNQPLETQKALLENKLKLWIGNEAQTDDVCMVGFTL